MTIHLDWPPEVVARLTDEARQKGLSLDAYLLQTVIDQKGPNGALPADEPARRQAREEAGRSIRQLRQGNILGPDLTVRELIEEGRRLSGATILRLSATTSAFASSSLQMAGTTTSAPSMTACSTASV